MLSFLLCKYIVMELLGHIVDGCLTFKEIFKLFFKVTIKLNIQKMKIMASSPMTPWEIDGEIVETVSDFIFWDPKSLQMVITAMKLKDTYSLEEKL